MCNNKDEIFYSHHITEIPGPTRKVPPPKYGGSDMNEVAKNTKTSQITGKESTNLSPPKPNYNSQDYDDNYSSNEDEDIDDRNGESYNFFLCPHNPIINDLISLRSNKKCPNTNSRNT